MISDADDAIRNYFHMLERLFARFNFQRKGREESLGKDAAHLVAEGILDRSINDQGGPGGKWASNDPDYTADKVKFYRTDLIGVRTGQMLSIPSLLGQVDVTEYVVLMKYGTGKAPTGSMSSAHLSSGDTRISDIEKAHFFTEKKGGFYELDDEIADRVKAYFAEALDDFIREANAR